MNIRLIGLGDVGQEVVLACTKYFQTKQIISLLESKKVVKLTTKEYADTINSLRGSINNAEAAACGVSCSSADALRSLRRALAYLFFGGPDDAFEERCTEILEAGTGDKKPTLEARPHIDFLQGLYANLEKVPGLRTAFRTHLDAGVHAHQQFLDAHESALGKDWLITPDLPVEEAELKSRCAGIGRELMKRILKSKNNKLERLTEGLGLVSVNVPIDVVAVAFSVGDSFGGCGADELALTIRAILQELNHNRIVALLGLAVYERNVEVLDGRYVSDYLGINREKNAFDGLIARSRTPDAIQGFGPILATIAMASDPRVIQIDNPDANQLQRDFGKSLVSCGQAESLSPSDAPAQAQLLTLYNTAKADLFRNHTYQGSFDLLGMFQESVHAILDAEPTWHVPKWVENFLAHPDVPGRIECETARKVVAYVGYDDNVNGDQINHLREALARDFPRARSVLYKYHVGDVVMWSGKRPQLAVAVPVTGDAVRLSPPVKPTNALPPTRLQPHVALFVIDSMETAALERFYDFLLNHVTILHRDGRALSWHSGDGLLIKTIVMRLLVRSLISVPSVGRDWSPPFADEAKTRYLSCPRDTVLGNVSEEFLLKLRASVAEVVGGETIEAGTLQNEVAKVYETVNTEQMPLLRKSRLERLEPRAIADVLCGLNWLCNEQLENRKVVCSLWETINPQTDARADSYY